MGNAGEGGSSSSGGLFNEGFLVWVASKDPFAGRPFLCLVLDRSVPDYVTREIKRGLTYSFLVINPVFVK